MLKKIVFTIFATFITTSFLFAQIATKIAPKREFRGVWVATVENIDWPSKPGLSIDEQKQELIGLLEQHKKNGMNAILLQVRPAADAFYRKSREPWSQWLMGKQG
ncbi:MAG TPA: family 10 glycosylhydrolase, partial [Pedobacter sp.]